MKACFVENLWIVKKGAVPFYQINETKEGRYQIYITEDVVSEVTEEFMYNML